MSQASTAADGVQYVEARWLDFRDVGAVALSQYVAAGLGFCTTVVAARLLGPTGYGAAALAMAYPTLVWSFVGTKAVSVTTRYIAAFRATGQLAEMRAICKVGYGIDLAAALVALILVGSTAEWVATSLYRIPGLTVPMLVYAASFPVFSLTGVASATLSSWERFRWLAMSEIAGAAVGFVTVLSLVLAGFGVVGVVMGSAFGHVVTGVTMSAAASSVLWRHGGGAWWNAPLASITSLRAELRSFFGWNYLMVTVSGLMVQLPLMLLGWFRGADEAGYFRLASSIVTVFSYIESSLAKVAYPALSVLVTARTQGNLAASLRRRTMRSGLLACVAILAMVPWLPVLVGMFLGPGYASMVSGAQVMMGGAAVSVLFFWLMPVYYASGRIRIWTVVNAANATVVLVLAVVVLQFGGFLFLSILLGVAKAMLPLVLLAALMSDGRSTASKHADRGG